MPNTTGISTPIKGMQSDLHQFNTNEQSYTFALNAMVEDFWQGNQNFLMNEPSNTCAINFPPNYKVVGFREIPEQNRTIYFLTNPTNGNNQIGEVLNCNPKDYTDKIKKVYCENCPQYVGEEHEHLEDAKENCYCTYTMILSANCLNFNINYPVDIEYKITNCGVNIYFTDNINERRFIYFDYTNQEITQPLVLQDRFKVQNGVTTGSCATPIYLDQLDCEKIKVHPNYNRPCILFNSFINGGNLKAGAYQVLIAYADAFGNPISTYFPSSAPATLFEEPIAFDTNYTTNKALKFAITGLKSDSLFQYYNVVIAQTIEQFTEFILVATLPTTINQYVYTGFEKTQKRLSPTEVFFKRPFYQKAKGVTTANDYLFYSGVTEYPTLNLQPVVNTLHLQWETVALKEGAYRDPRNVYYFRTYQRDETYVFGLVFEFNNGRETCAFPMVGRAATSYDLEQVCNADSLTIPTCDIAQNICAPLVPSFEIILTTDKFGNPVKYLAVTVATLDAGDTFDLSFDGGNTYESVASGLNFNPYYYDLLNATNANVSVVVRRHCAAGGTSLSLNYHIVITGSATTITTTTTPVTSCKPRWQVYNTGSVVGTPHEYNEACELDKCWEYGEFAYTESTDRYPNIPEVWGSLCGQPIRHHKFPDSCITHIHDSKDGNKVYADNNYVFPIGVRIDHAQVIAALNQAVTSGLITAEQRAQIVSYRIVRGNRVGNKSIDAKGLLFNMFEYDKFGKHYYFPNYSYNDVTTDDFLDEVELAPAQRFTFHSPDVHFVNTSLGNILKLETEEYGQSEGYFTFSECQPKYKFLNEKAHLLAFGLGMAAAISATGEKECKDITYISQYQTDVKDFPVQDTHGGMRVNALTYGTGDIDTHIESSVNKRDYKEEENHNTSSYRTWDSTTGFPNNQTEAAQEKITTCRGQAWQIFNSNGVILGLLGGANQVIQRTILGIIEMNKVLDTLRALIPSLNYSVQYNSVGKYNNYKCTPVGNKNRLITKSAYLEPFNQLVDEPSDSVADGFTTVNINNWDRESSVYLKTNTVFTNPTVVDNSKVSMGQQNLHVGDLDKTFNRTISSYYASIKNEILNQYGQLCNIEFLETNACSFFLNKTYTACETKVFGGDTFINRFALKRKMSFFKHTMCKLPDDSDVLYSELANAGVPKYYFNTPQPLADRIDNLGFFGGIISAITTDNLHNYDVDKGHLFHQEGYVPLFSYGVPFFLVESDFNVDYRFGQNNTDKDFYPHNRDLKTWFEEEYVPIHTDNFYFYNRTYSKQNKESDICTSCILDYRQLTCQDVNTNRIIYSDSLTTENKNDNWNIFKANNYYNFPLTLGKLVTADGIENDKVLVRLEKGTQIFNAYDTIQTTEGNIQVGTGGLFQSRPKDLAITDLGYAGTQHRDILHTEFGHIWADADRGQIFNLASGASGLNELAKDGMKAWFKENLPFQLKRDFKNFTDYDNNLNGVGLHFCFDKRFNRILVTKLDYKVLDPLVTYNSVQKQFQKVVNNVTTAISLQDSKYFCNKSWTISYNFFNQSWTSFHSYTPLFYVEHIDTFDSAVAQPVMIGNTLGIAQKMYTHNFSNKSYQVFYGKLQPFIVEYQTKQSFENNIVNSVDFYLDVIRYHNEFDTFYSRTKTFNKAIVYNNYQTTGLLNLIVDNPENLTQLTEAQRTPDGLQIYVTNFEQAWQFNNFYDVVASQTNNVPIFNYDCANVNKHLNNKALNYNRPDIDKQQLRQRMCKVRLINDVESNYRYIFTFGVVNQNKS